jgi:hypothetical protein
MPTNSGKDKAFPRISLRNWEALGISYKAGQRRLGMQRHRIMQAGFDSRSPHILAQPVAVLAAHDVDHGGSETDPLPGET